MTYYDELGVAQDASPEEIRKAFHGVSRMLHPDLQPEGVLRHLAEAQMKRLNEVVETLCHEDRRLIYDSALYPLLTPIAAEKPESPQNLTPLPALLAGLVFGCLLMYCISVLTKPEFEAAQRPIDEGPVMMTPPGASLNAAKPHGAATVGPQRSSNLTEQKNTPSAAVMLAADTPTLPPEIREASPKAIPLPKSDIAGLLSPPPAPPAALPKPLAGIWLHAADPKEKPAQWAYAAEYVELRLQEANGEIVGAYRSRYRVPDKAFQPEVIFRFRGPAQGREFEWEGAGGIRGKIQLQIHGDNVMEASWKVADTHTVSGLAAGSATLVRRLD